MTRQKFVKATIISMALGLALGIGLCYSNQELYWPIILFCPVWFLGIYFCGTPWNRFLPWLAGYEIHRIYRREVKGDKYDVVSNLIGAMIFCYFIIIGWLVGLGKFVVFLVKFLKKTL